jgi:hypothetical protein
LLYTDGTLSRPWCLLELHAAAMAEIPIIVMQVANSYKGDAQEFTKTLFRLPQYLAETNPQAVDMLTGPQHLLDLESLGATILNAIPNSQMLEFDPNRSSLSIQGQIQSLASAIVRQVCVMQQQLVAVPPAFSLPPRQPDYRCGGHERRVAQRMSRSCKTSHPRSPRLGPSIAAWRCTSSTRNPTALSQSKPLPM